MQRPFIKTETTDSKGKSLIQCLSTCELGTELIVVKVDAGHMAKNRLGDLGIVPGVKIVKKKSAPFKGPVEIEVRGSSLVIGRGLASKIIVKCNSTCDIEQ
ncbi:MAG: ferrous iron transport protein A [Promethearchaeota archaeon]